MAEFDFNALLENPQFAFGLSLLGGAHPKNAPLLQALQMTQMMQKNKREQEREKDAAEVRKQQGELYKAQIAEMARKGQLESKQQQAQQKWMQEMQQMIGGGMQPPGQAQPTPPAIDGQPALQIPPAAPAMPPQAPGAVVSALEAAPPPDRLAWIKPEWKERWTQVESGGNQFDPKTGLPLTSPKGAVGKRQVMPATGPEAAKLAGEPWDARRLAFDEAYNERLGDAYLNKQYETFKGNPAQAFAAYNAGPGAVQKALATAEQAKHPDLWLSLLPKETRDYVATILGPQEPQVNEEEKAKALPSPSPLGYRNAALPIAMKAATGAAMGFKGAQAFVDVAKMMEPKNVPAGSYQQDASGKMTFMPDPSKKEELKIKREQLEMDKIKKGIDTGKITAEMAQDKGKAFQAIENVDASMQRLHDTAAQLKNHPGLNRITGITGGLINPRLLGKNARNAAAILETLKAQAFTNATLALRQASPTGAGVGSQSDAEGNKLTDSFARLNQAQGLKEFQAALEDLMNYAQGAKTRMRKAYEVGFGKVPEGSAQTQLPAGSRQIGTFRGKPVYESLDGKRFVVE